MNDKPFFTIVMRCCERPKMMSYALDTVLEQTYKNLEVILIPDMKQCGVRWANKQFGLNVDRCDGQYVMTLDDDSSLYYNNILRDVHKAIVQNNYPDVLMVKSKRPKFEPRVLPKEYVWGNRDKMKVATTNGGCFISSLDVWKQYAHKYGRAGSGDWNYLGAVNRNKELRFAWLNKISREAQQIGRGVKFEKCGKNWLAGVIAKYGFIDVGNQDWRLQLWKKK